MIILFVSIVFKNLGCRSQILEGVMDHNVHSDLGSQSQLEMVCVYEVVELRLN